ncbi:MAG: hypothetical protein RIR53_63 [Bacteroidota bacterium]
MLGATTKVEIGRIGAQNYAMHVGTSPRSILVV